MLAYYHHHYYSAGTFDSSNYYVVYFYRCRTFLWSVCLCAYAGHTGEPCKNGRRDWDAVWGADLCEPKEWCINCIAITLKTNNKQNVTECLQGHYVTWLLIKLNKRKSASCTRYVHSAVLDADGVDSHFLRYELDAVLTGAEVLNVAHLCHSRRTRYRRLHVITVCTYNTRAPTTMVLSELSNNSLQCSDETASLKF